LSYGIFENALFQSQHVLHVINAGFLFDHPERGAQGAVGKSVTVGGLVREFKALAVVGENDRVIANHIAAANRVHADFGRGSFADDAFATVTHDFLELLFADARENFSERLCRAAGRVFF